MHKEFLGGIELTGQSTSTRWWKLRSASSVCVVLIAFSSLILGAYWVNHAVAAGKAEAATLANLEKRASMLAAALEEQTRGALHTIDLALLHLSHLHAGMGKLAEADVQLVKDATPSGLVRRVTVMGVNGRVIATYPGGGAGMDFSDRPHFVAHTRGDSTGLYVGRPIMSRIDGEWVIPLSRGLVDGRGAFAGVIAVMVRPEYLSSIYGRLAGGRDDVLALVHRDGAFLARNKNLDRHLGKSVSADRPFMSLQGPPAGVFRSVSTLESTDRVFAYRRLGDWPLVAVTGVGVVEGLEPLRAGHAEESRAALAVSGLVSLLVVAVCVVVVRLDRSLARVAASDARRAMAVAGASELAWEWDVLATRIFFLGDCSLFFGENVHERSATLGEWATLIHPDDMHGVRSATCDFMAGRSAALDCRFRMRFSKGEYRWVLSRGQAVARDPGGRLLRAMGILMDVDEEKKAQLAAAQTRETYARVIASSSEGIVVVDRQGCIRMINPAVERMLGWRSAEVPGRLANALFQCRPEQLSEKDADCPIQATLNDGEVRQGYRLSYFHRDGHRVPVEVSVAPIVLEERVDGAVAMVSDITPQLAYEENLERLARTDGLTGLWNRRYFVELFEHEMKRAEREDAPLSLMMIDIDYFKRINDRFGHSAGDVALAALSGLIRQKLRQVDIVGRLGGEEFAVGLPGIDLPEALVAAERLRAAQEASPVGVGDNHIAFTISVGVVQWTIGESFDAVLGRADAAMYRAKDGGRNRVLT